MKEKERLDKRRKLSSKLSFINNEDDDDEGGTSNELVDKKIKKNPDVDTSFLPDKERDLAIELEKEKLKLEWLKEQDKIKNEILEVVYSYWDGYGHRKSIKVKKGTTIGRFLELIRHDLSQEFHDLKSVNMDGMMYVKEDIIIPHNYSFYDLITTKARGKSGPLFHFDVHEDIRLVNDIRIEKDESHPGKVVLRRWYEKNKHIFPSSRWEVYDPNAQHDKYTISDTLVNK
uniref:FAM50A/XAP5 C-terminal domain-containing protein n=1 Tax=Chromulina nebulosa TaxID=96789 RepID=A0A7S0XE71_9STRA